MEGVRDDGCGCCVRVVELLLFVLFLCWCELEGECFLDWMFEVEFGFDVWCDEVVVVEWGEMKWVFEICFWYRS